MEFITSNGVRFTRKDKEFTLENYIVNREDITTVLLLDDIFIDFKNGLYMETYEIPF